MEEIYSDISVQILDYEKQNTFLDKGTFLKNILFYYFTNK